jgi:alkylated DNA repair protein alkB family protein 1
MPGWLKTLLIMQKQQQQQQQHLDPHQRPPQAIRAVYKLYQKKKTPVDLDTDEHIIHLTSASHASLPSNVHVVRELMVHDLMPVFRTFAASDMNVELQHHDSASTIAVYEHDDMPGKGHLLNS